MDVEARTARLIDARRLSAAHKRRHALQTIDAVRRRGDRVTYAGIAREAAVSGWFVRNQPDVRAAIARALREDAAAGTPDKRTSGNRASTDGLRSELLLAREEIRGLRRERDHLRQNLRTGLGVEVDHASRRELLERIADLERRNEELSAEHAAAQRNTSELQTALADLAAVRAVNRRLMQQVNAPG